MLKLWALALCVAFVNAASLPEIEVGDVDLPVGTITCQIDTPHRDECVKEAIQDMLPKLANGIENLQIPPIDPYYLENFPLEAVRGESFSAAGTVRKLLIRGASSAVVNDVKLKITKNHISAMFKVYFPESYAEGYYSGEGRFNNLKLKSKGFFNITASNSSSVARTEGDIITVNGKEYLKLTKFDFIPHFGSLKVYATGLFPDPELNRVTLEFINQYWPFLVREMTPIVQKQLEPFMLEQANKFLLQVPLRKMLYYGEEETA